MKKNLATLLLSIICLAYPLLAKCDHIVVNGATMRIFSNEPLENYPFIKQVRDKLTGYGSQCTEDGCQFSAEWRIVEHHLMLVAIHSCECNDKHLSANLNSLFKGKLVNGWLNAQWFTGNIWLTDTQPVDWLTMISPIYSRETCVTVSKGMVTNIRNVVNPNILRTPFNTEDSLNRFIYTHINWDKIDKLPAKGTPVNFDFHTDSTGKPIDIKLNTWVSPQTPQVALDNKLISEAQRALAMTRWPVRYLHGKMVDWVWPFSITFSKELKDKYNPQH